MRAGFFFVPGQLFTTMHNGSLEVEERRRRTRRGQKPGVDEEGIHRLYVCMCVGERMRACVCMCVQRYARYAGAYVGYSEAR